MLASATNIARKARAAMQPQRQSRKAHAASLLQRARVRQAKRKMARARMNTSQVDATEVVGHLKDGTTVRLNPHFDAKLLRSNEFKATSAERFAARMAQLRANRG